MDLSEWTECGNTLWFLLRRKLTINRLLNNLTKCSPTKCSLFFKFFFSFSEFFLYIFIGYNCFTMLCYFLLYNKVNQPYAYIYPHIPSFLSLPPTLPIPPLQVIAKHRADPPVLCCFPLAICFTFGSVYVSMLHSLCPRFPLPIPCVLKSILYVYIFISFKLMTTVSPLEIGDGSSSSHHDD